MKNYLICDPKFFERVIELQRGDHERQFSTSDLVRFQRQRFQSFVGLDQIYEPLIIEKKPLFLQSLTIYSREKSQDVWSFL